MACGLLQVPHYRDAPLHVEVTNARSQIQRAFSVDAGGKEERGSRHRAAECPRRHFTKYSLTQKGKFVPNGRKDRTMVLVDIRETPSAKAADMLKASCGGDQAVTPPARLVAVSKRLDVMLQAVKTVRTSLDDFYGKLSDEQKAQFEAIGPRRTGAERCGEGRRRQAKGPRSARRVCCHQRSSLSVAGMVMGWRQAGLAS